MDQSPEDARTTTNILAFAQIAYQQAQAYKAAVGAPVSQSWSAITSDDQKKVIDRVMYYLTNPNAVVSSLHDDWAHSLYRVGWSYGTVIDDVKKTDPWLVPFSELPLTRQVEDLLFMQTVTALSRLL